MQKNEYLCDFNKQLTKEFLCYIILKINILLKNFQLKLKTFKTFYNQLKIIKMLKR